MKRGENMMRKKMPLAFVSVLLLVSIAAAAEPGDTLWTRTYGGSSDDKAMSVEQTTDGGYIAAGLTYSFGAGSADLYLVKMDAFGDTLWTRVYGGVGFDYALGIQETDDGGYVVAAGTSSFGAGDMDFYLIKTDASGDTLWCRTYGGSDPDVAFSVDQTIDGGYIFAGYSMSFGAGDMDFYLIKTDASGDSLWSRTYGGSGSDWGLSVQQTADGGYIVAGRTDSFGAGSNDLYLVKADAAGDTLWTRTYGATGSENAYSVQQTTDEGYIVGGLTNSFGSGGFDFFLVKTDVSGDTVWTTTYGGSNDDFGTSVWETTDGGYILAGYTNSFGAGGQDFYLVKTDEDGQALWTRTYGGGQDDAAYSIQQTPDEGYIVAGLTYSSGAGEADFYLVRVPKISLTLTIVAGDTVVAHHDRLCYHLICRSYTPDYLSLWFKVEVQLPNGQMYGPIFGPARFGMFGNGISEGDMCHRVPAPAPVGDYWLFAEAYNAEYSAIDSMAFTVTGDGGIAGLSFPLGEWETLLARIGDWTPLGAVAETGLPTRYAPSRNHPNPFNARTTIKYQLPVESYVKLEVYNLLGQKVATLADEKQAAGYRSVIWDASEVSSGLYFYRLTAGDYTDTRRMMLVK
jgi:hypothetical protein